MEATTSLNPSRDFPLKTSPKENAGNINIYYDRLLCEINIFQFVKPRIFRCLTYKFGTLHSFERGY